MLAVIAVVGWLVGSGVLVLPALLYDGSFGAITSTADIKMTPALFLANNVGLALMIPVAWLAQLAATGQRPRWLSSVAGRFRWGWFARCLLVVLVPYLLVFTIELVIGGLPDVQWKPYSLFMIATVLLTTPFQCAGEEYGLRGLANRSVAALFPSEKVGFWIGAVLSSLLFMWLHAAQDIYLNIFYFSFGMIGCFMAYRTGGLEASVALHVVNNLVSMVFLPFTDFSNMLDRSSGTASAGDLIWILPPILIVLALVEWQRRAAQPQNRSAPDATAVATTPAQSLPNWGLQPNQPWSAPANSPQQEWAHPGQPQNSPDQQYTGGSAATLPPAAGPWGPSGGQPQQSWDGSPRQ